MNSPTLPARGEPTRDALIRAAVEIFGRDGFNAASTRAISEAAGVNQALIGYHFGGKPGLYLAALRCIAASVSGRLGPLVTSIKAELAAATDTSDAGAQRALAALHRLVDAFVGMLASDESASWARIILREQQDPSDGFDVLYEGFMRRMLDVTLDLVRRARKRDEPEAECKVLVLTILGQAVVFRAARAAVMREMQWQQIGPAELECIRAQLRRNVAAIVRAESTP